MMGSHTYAGWVSYAAVVTSGAVTGFTAVRMILDLQKGRLRDRQDIITAVTFATLTMLAALCSCLLRGGVEAHALERAPVVRAVPKTPSPRGARPRQDIRPRVLVALTPEPSTAAEIAERASLPGRKRVMHAARV